MNVPATTHFDGWISLLISSAPETPTSTEFNSIYSHVTERHDTQSLTYLSMQHWIQPKVFIFRVSGPPGFGRYIHPHTSEWCLWAVLALLPVLVLVTWNLFFFTAGLNYLSAGESFMRSQSKTLGLIPMGVTDYTESYLLLHVRDTVFGLAFSYRSRDWAIQTSLLSERHGK